MQYPLATVGTVVTLAVSFFVERIGSLIIHRHSGTQQQRYTWKSNLQLTMLLVAAAIVSVLWIRLFHNKGTFLGLLGAGLAVALREPLLSIAGRISIWASHVYRIGDRIEFQHMAGDVIDIGIFYTRLLEIGNWVGGDQATGRIVQFPNSSVYQHSVYNYTRDFSFIWDEVVLPVTYGSDIREATKILVSAGKEYTRKFLPNAESEIVELREALLIPDVKLEPSVFMRVTSNYVELTLRYLVFPRQRRVAASYLYERIFQLVRENERIDIGSSTMDLTVHPPQKKSAQEDRVA